MKERNKEIDKEKTRNKNEWVRMKENGIMSEIMNEQCVKKTKK